MAQALKLAVFHHLQAAKIAGITQLCPRADLITADKCKDAVDKGFTLRAWALSNKEVSNHGDVPTVLPYLYLHAGFFSISGTSVC